VRRLPPPVKEDAPQKYLRQSLNRAFWRRAPGTSIFLKNPPVCGWIFLLVEKRCGVFINNWEVSRRQKPTPTPPRRGEFFPVTWFCGVRGW
jgi:hypothetical protein